MDKLSDMLLESISDQAKNKNISKAYEVLNFSHNVAKSKVKTWIRNKWQNSIYLQITLSDPEEIMFLPSK